MNRWHAIGYLVLAIIIIALAPADTLKPQAVAPKGAGKVTHATDRKEWRQ